MYEGLGKPKVLKVFFNVFWKLVSSCWGWQKLLETSNTLCIRVRVCLCLRPKASAVPTKPSTSATVRQVWKAWSEGSPGSSPLLRAVSSSGRGGSRQDLIRLIAFTEPTESQSESHDMDKPKRSTFSGSACQWFGIIQLRKIGSKENLFLHLHYCILYMHS